MKQIVQLVGQVKGSVLPVDIREMFRQAGIPLMSEKQQKQQEQEIAKEAEAMQPSPMAPTPRGMQGYNAGVEKTPQGYSVYVQPPQRIDLSTSHQGFLAELPSVPAYGDASVRASMMRLRKMMLDRYQEQIASFVEHLRSATSLHLAQQSNQGSQQARAAQQGAQTPAQPAVSGLSPAQAQGVAGASVSAWRGQQGVPVIGVALAAILLAIAVRAAKRELKAAHLDTGPDYESSLRLWADQRASFVLDSIDKTIDGEMTNFLGSELQRETDPSLVADAAQERFADTAQTHADRVVLSEVLPSYNFGMLTALRDAGVSQVQAHDASDGRDQLTDSECRRDDGQVFSVEEALDRSAQEHPHGTLYWTVLSTDNLRVERVERLPTHLNGKPDQIAAYDAEAEVIYLSMDASEDHAREAMLAMGEVLRIR
jgi:hypothetical protein